jgi:hypothetical protein
MPESPHWMTHGFWLGFRVVSPAKEPAEAEKLRYWNADDLQTIRVLHGGREMHDLVEQRAAPAEQRR